MSRRVCLDEIYVRGFKHRGDHIWVWNVREIIQRTIKGSLKKDLNLLQKQSQAELRNVAVHEPLAWWRPVKGPDMGELTKDEFWDFFQPQ